MQLLMAKKRDNLSGSGLGNNSAVVERLQAQIDALQDSQVWPISQSALLRVHDFVVFVCL